MNMIRLSIVSLLVLALQVNAGSGKNKLSLEQLQHEREVVQQKQRYHEVTSQVRKEEGRLGGGQGAMSHTVWAQQCAIHVAQLTKQIERLK